MQLMVLFFKRNFKYFIWFDLSEIGSRLINVMEYHLWIFTGFDQKLVLTDGKYFGQTNSSAEKKNLSVEIIDVPFRKKRLDSYL